MTENKNFGENKNLWVNLKICLKQEEIKIMQYASLALGEMEASASVHELVYLLLVYVPFCLKQCCYIPKAINIT